MLVRVMSYSKAESERSGFMGTGSPSLDERHVVRNVRGEVEADGRERQRGQAFFWRFFPEMKL
jgi:hypothetical protein